MIKSLSETPLELPPLLSCIEVLPIVPPEEYKNISYTKNITLAILNAPLSMKISIRERERSKVILQENVHDGYPTQ